MKTILWYLGGILIGYLIGNINTAAIIARCKGFDIRTKGSGNAGASNALVTMGKGAAVCSALVDILKCSAPGFVYSVGLAPVLAGASLKALEIMQREPERVARLHERGQLFQRLVREAGLNVGASCGFSIVPVIVGSSKKAVVLSNQLFACGINVQPIIHPAVEEKAARLRFFLSSEHTEEEIARTCRILAGLIQGRDMAHDLE